jgi:2-iminobutanoate/2-iminopropanoate deaminase
MRFVRGSLVLSLCLAGALGAQQQQGAGKQVVVPAGGRGSANLSPGIRVGNLLFVSGQVGMSRTAPDSTIQGQTKAALENIKNVLEAAHTTPENVVKCTVFLLDIKDFQGMNSAYTQFFTSNPPARSTVAVAGLASAGAKVEIECIATIP